MRTTSVSTVSKDSGSALFAVFALVSISGNGQRRLKLDVRTRVSIRIPFRFKDLTPCPLYGDGRPFSKKMLK